MTTKVVSIEEEFSNGFFDIAAFTHHAFSSRSNLASIFDHTLLKPDATRDQVVRLCEEAAQYGFACAMVNPAWVSTACSVLSGTGIRVGTVLGFPLGASLSITKREEAVELIKLGAHDLDMVLNIGLLKSGMNDRVQQDIHGVVEVAHEAGAIVKVILETCLLNVEEKLRASEVAIAAGADFLKTSTGFSTGGATPEDVALLRGVAGGRSGVKASGGIRTLAETRAMLEAGANRIGASASVSILREFDAL
ncbi:MAG TPA: deoxyribose-phosphate aldolase [Pseudacidobacterium sp.]|nr:deoxyribose-phosphate aldolase [Pseudacidobacterium sp.]